MHKVTLTNLVLTILIAICSAASLTDEDIAKILDGTTGGDGMANLGEYETDLQLGNLRDKLRTLENLKTANTDLYPAQDPEILSDAIPVKGILSLKLYPTFVIESSGRLTVPVSNAADKHKLYRDGSDRSLHRAKTRVPENIRYPVEPPNEVTLRMCELFCPQRQYTVIAIDLLQICRKMKCFEGSADDAKISSIQPIRLSPANSLCNDYKCGEAKQEDQSWRRRYPETASDNVLYTNSNKIVRDLSESDRIIRHLSDVVYRQCTCIPCNEVRCWRSIF